MVTLIWKLYYSDVEITKKHNGTIYLAQTLFVWWPRPGIEVDTPFFE